MLHSLIHEALISLIEARCILDSPTKWARGDYAQSAEGKGVFTNGPEAIKYDVQGAMWRSAISRSTSNKHMLTPAMIGDIYVSEIVNKATLFCVPYLPTVSGTFYSEGSKLVNFNDRIASHKDILLVLEKAIVDAKEAFEQELLNTKNGK